GNATRIDLQWCLVNLHLHTAATDPGTDRRQLLAEQPLLYGCLGTPYRLQRPGILLLATEAMALGTVFGKGAHQPTPVIGIFQPVEEHVGKHTAMPHAQPLTRTIQQVGGVGHAFHATGHDDVDTAGTQQVAAAEGRLPARSTLLVQRGADSCLGEAGARRSWPGRGLTQACWQYAAHQYFLYGLGRQAAALDCCANRRSTELRGGNTGKFTL